MFTISSSILAGKHLLIWTLQKEILSGLHKANIVQPVTNQEHICTLNKRNKLK